jgi:hypothetical protein
MTFWLAKYIPEEIKKIFNEINKILKEEKETAMEREGKFYKV